MLRSGRVLTGFRMARRNRYRTPKSLVLGSVKEKLPSVYWTRLLYKNGNLKVDALRRAIEENHPIPDDFVDAVNGLSPLLNLPYSRVPENPTSLESLKHNDVAEASMPHADTTVPEKSAAEDADEDVVENSVSTHGKASKSNPGSHGFSKRKFTNLFNDSSYEEGATSKRTKDDDSRAKLMSHFGMPTTDHDHDHDDAVPVTFQSERNPLVALKMAHYMILPNNWEIPECPSNRVGAGLNLYNPGPLLISGVYVLAKAQGLGFGWENDKAIRWAVLRMEAFCAGWYDRQKYTMFMEAPSTSFSTFMEDRYEIMKYLKAAVSLCSFLPFLDEFQFRAYMSSYQKTNNPSEYVRRAYKLAKAARMQDVLTYLDNDILFGSVLSWVDVKRPMEVLKDSEACYRIPNVFQTRKSAAPAGQALIKTAVAIIASLEKANWWAGIKEAGRYEEEKLITICDKISADPWKYHIMCHCYGLKKLTGAELDEVEEGNRLAIWFAPILQAYNDTFMANTDLGKAKALKKYAYANHLLYSRALNQFRIARKKRCEAIAGLFENKAIQPEKIFPNRIFQPEKVGQRETK